jgi:hypothetical protein
MSSPVIPPNLNQTYRAMSGFRKQLLRFYPDRSGAINPQDTLRWTLPKEIMLMDTLMHYFEFTSTLAQTGTTLSSGTYFPRNSASIIDTITVFINGQVFENIPSYNHLFNVIYDNTAGYNFYNSGIRALECADPSIKYTTTPTSTTSPITAVIQGAQTGTTAAALCEQKRPLQIRNWIGFLGTCNKVLDLTNVEVIIEIRYAPAVIMFRGLDATGTPTNVTPTYTIDNYYMTVQKITFDDDYYQLAINSLKASGNYSITFKTFSMARSAAVARSSNPVLQFSTTAKWLSKLYFTFLDPSFDTMTYILNQGANATTATKSMSELVADLKTNIIAFNQSRFFQKNAVDIKEVQIEINGLPCYPFPMPPHLIKNNNFDALDIEDNNLIGDYVGLQSLEQWNKYGFLNAISFEHEEAWKNGIISGYPNPTQNLLNIKYTTNFNGTNTENVYILAFAERVVKANFFGSSVQIEM